MAAAEVTLEPGREWHLDVRFPATPKDVGRVRRALSELGLPTDVLEDAQLLATELVTNSVKYAGLRPDELVRITARWSGTSLRVDVFDREHGPSGDAVAGGIRPSPGAESGWGLYLIDRVASRWGNSPGHYWFEIEAPETER